MTHNLRNRVALITGASRGIGKGIARTFAELGANVVLVSREASAGAKTSAELRAITGANVVSCSGDVTDLSSMRNAATVAAEKFGGLDILCANAGIFPSTPLVEMTLDEWDKVFDVNVRGTLVSVQACLPFLRESDAGRIVVTLPSLGQLRDSRAGPTTALQELRSWALFGRPLSSYRDTESVLMRFCLGISKPKVWRT